MGWPVDITAEAVRLREAAEARPLKLPVRRRVDETHRAITDDGLTVWFTIQLSGHARIHDALFERADRTPSDEECEAWLRELMPGHEPLEAPRLPASRTRHFEAFERDAARAPLA
jgi:hypothetical protein